MNNVVVTGATRGIGEAIAKRLVKDGYFVYGTYSKSADKAQHLTKELKNIKFLQADLSDRKQTQKLINDLKGIELYAIVNNAGVLHLDEWTDLDLNKWDETIEVNLTAPLILIQQLTKKMKKGTSVVNIASTDGTVGAYDGVAYAASKAGLINLTMSAANLLGPRGIRVNAVAPGWIETAMVSEEAGGAGAEVSPLARNGKPEEVASVVSFLISDDASFVNGTTATVDGGDSGADYALKKEAGL